MISIMFHKTYIFKAHRFLNDAFSLVCNSCSLIFLSTIFQSAFNAICVKWSCLILTLLKLIIYHLVLIFYSFPNNEISINQVL